MAEYIEREAALAFQNELEPMVCKSIMTDELFSATKDSDLVAFLQNIPSADVVTRDCYDRLLSENDKLRKVRPVVHAKWGVTEAYPHNVYCTHCYKIYAQTHWTVWEDGSLPRDFCPKCGARMDGDADA